MTVRILMSLVVAFALQACAHDGQILGDATPGANTVRAERAVTERPRAHKRSVRKRKTVRSVVASPAAPKIPAAAKALTFEERFQCHKAAANC